MTQRECDILKASVSGTDKVLTVKEEKAFQAGVKWANKTMIEKALQWLKAHIKFETVNYSDVWDVSVVDILAIDFATVDEMEESFRKTIGE